MLVWQVPYAANHPVIPLMSYFLCAEGALYTNYHHKAHTDFCFIIPELRLSIIPLYAPHHVGILVRARYRNRQSK